MRYQGAEHNIQIEIDKLKKRSSTRNEARTGKIYDFEKEILVPQQVLDAMRQAFSDEQGNQHIRILQDCLDICKTTANLDTFFTRKELALQSVMTLEQAQAAGLVKIKQPLYPAVSAALKNYKIMALNRSCQKEQQDIGSLKTAKGKINRWNKYLELLDGYRDEFEFDEEYSKVKEQVHLEIEKLSQ